MKMNLTEILNRLPPRLFPKGSERNPYDFHEFPRHHICGVSPEELDRLEQIWIAHPEWHEKSDGQPDWDNIFQALEGKKNQRH